MPKAKGFKRHYKLVTEYAVINLSDLQTDASIDKMVSKEILKIITVQTITTDATKRIKETNSIIISKNQDPHKTETMSLLKPLFKIQD